MGTVQIVKDMLGVTTVYFDTTGVSTASAAETNLFKDGAFPDGTGTTGYISNGFINLGPYAGGEGNLQWFETAGYAGTLKVYAGTLGQSTTGQAQVGASQTITASGGDAPVVISSLPQYLRVTITRSTSDITVKYRLQITRKTTL